MGKLVVLKLFKTILAGFTVFMLLVAVLSASAGYVSPHQFAALQWLGLFLPVTILINLVLLIFWCLKRNRLAILPVLAILVNWAYLSGVIQFSVDRQQAQHPLKVASYNVAEMKHDQRPDLQDLIVRFAAEEQVDVLCMQEFPLLPKEKADSLLGKLHFLPYHSIHQTHAEELRVAVFSKYPILRAETIVFEESNNCAMWVDLSIGRQTIRVFNCHLQTTNINQQRHLLQAEATVDKQQVEHIKEMLNHNFRLRATQADLLRSLIDTTAYPVILCGDFNDTPASYVYRTIKGDMKDSFKTCGKGYQYTYRYLKKLLRIDYIFYSGEDFKGVRHYSPRFDYSDHHPVVTVLDMM